MSTSERKTPRSRLRACWRLLFALVGAFDCSCFCYFHYHHIHFSSKNNKVATTHRKHTPKSCSPIEEWQGRDLFSLPETRPEDHLKNKTENKHYFIKSTLVGKKSSFHVSDIVWQSMAFSFAADTDHGKENKLLHQHHLEESSHRVYHTFLLLHLVFGILCCIEMILRAREARKIVFENQAIAAVEENIASAVAKVYHRRNLLRGKGNFSQFALRRASNMIGTKLSLSITTRAQKLQEETEESSDQNENRNQEYDRNNDDGQNNNNGDDIDMAEQAANKRNILLFLRSTFKLWLPIGVTCFFWLSLLPFKAYYKIVRIFLNDVLKSNLGRGCSDGNYCGIDCDHLCDVDAATECYVETLGDDTALATRWITACWARWIEACEDIQDCVSELWKQYLLGGLFTTHAGKKLHIVLNRPKLIWFRLGRILKIIKWVRFAFPLARMVIKLQDQLLAGYYTFRKVRSVRTNREKRLRHPSLLLEDLRRIESFHKVETTIAAWPSQCNILLEALTKEVSQYSEAAQSQMRFTSTMALAHAEEFLQRSRERGRQISRQIQHLQGQLRKNITDFSYSEIYDNILRLSQGISKRNLFFDHEHSNKEMDIPEGNEKSNQLDQIARKTVHRSHLSHRSSKHRWYDFLHLQTLLSSRNYLISPRSRFSVIWRITVTNCLLLELMRLSISWYLTQTFHLSITQLIGRLFVDCGNTNEATRHNFKVVTDLFEEWHAGLARAIPLVPFPKDSLWILCVPTSMFSKMLLLLGSAIETFIDAVSFMDIFFWFFTGDLDAATGIVVPKPFFGRCILPGTLVQVIDHPTLPNFLPSVMAKLASFASEVGWSRLVLWACALFPALVAEVILPLATYFFRHYEERNNWDKSGRRSITNKDNDILMAYAESFGYLPTRSRPLLEENSDERKWGGSQSNSDDDDDDDFSSISESFSRWPSHIHKSIIKPPGSPRRNNRQDSSVRFSNNVPMVPTNGSEDGSSQQFLHSSSSADFDIGLSLSYNDLDGLDNYNS